MIIPGSNLLGLALSVIGSQSVRWFKYSGSTTGPTGLVTITYNQPVTVTKGSVQPVDRSRYEAYGLDWLRSYVTWFVPSMGEQPITRNPDEQGDVIEWNNRRYQVVGDTPWGAIDQWVRLLCIDIGPATGALTNA